MRARTAVPLALDDQVAQVDVRRHPKVDLAKADSTASEKERRDLAKLIYSMNASLDGFIAGPDGTFDWSVPDEELHRFHNDSVRALGGHLLGRRLYETMVYWETAHEDPDMTDYARDARASTRARE